METFSFKAMACECTILVDAPPHPDLQHTLDLTRAEVLRIQDKYSRYNEHSVISQINCRAGQADFECDTETQKLIDFAVQLHHPFDRVFDLTSGALRHAWDFSVQQLPSPQKIEAALALVGWDKVCWNGKTIQLDRPGMELDLGGIGKEYAVDRIAHILTQAGYHSALINFGGDVFATGPKKNGSPWQVGIRHPRKNGQLIATLPLSQGGLATSGDYERYIVVNGQRFSHLLNVKTGWPVNYWQSISVLAPTCMLAGAMSTTFMLMEDKAIPCLKSCGLTSLCISAAFGVQTFPQK